MKLLLHIIKMIDYGETIACYVMPTGRKAYLNGILSYDNDVWYSKSIDLIGLGVTQDMINQYLLSNNMCARVYYDQTI